MVQCIKPRLPRLYTTRTDSPTKGLQLSARPTTDHQAKIFIIIIQTLSLGYVPINLPYSENTAKQKRILIQHT